LPPEIETVTYYVVAEALTNIGKHCAAHRSRVSIRTAGPRLVVEVSDDGRGGADPDTGSSLSGMAERVEATGGTLSVVSRPGAGTTVRAVLPCA
jgi:signal transduction histidine kinase